jgi:hypothetical protein
MKTIQLSFVLAALISAALGVAVAQNVSSQATDEPDASLSRTSKIEALAIKQKVSESEPQAPRATANIKLKQAQPKGAALQPQFNPKEIPILSPPPLPPPPPPK